MSGINTKTREFRYDPNRPEWNEWNLYLKKYIPKMPLKNDQDRAPEYGYIFDKLRQRYQIYVSIIPKVDTKTENTGKVVFRYMGRLIRLLDGNEVLKEITISGYSYHTIAQKLTRLAVDLIESGDVMKDRSIMDDTQYKELSEEIEKLKNNQPVFNVDKNIPLEEGYYTPENARRVIPANIRKPGLIIVYQTGPMESINEQFVGSNIEDESWVLNESWESIVTSASGINNIITLSQSEYDKLPEKDPSILYIIV